ncbi:hypothetical protein CNMCM8980_004198 [Aspergillus fumigatiaffinis]|jgi:hypothetical protein|uniref:Uncharacterized protein n=1 Tax=Aspergillus fumigatiaffinis TaxID=340414 RepID=A0A8H4MD32_9EURO|nr:hypothetical protein CNMCM5878_007722 [Aspergillus fumigatiaffinis]KAF4233741.1 hypothetical protein CNMCM6457_004374 [Aspergillus fumigatiaffinis]KAF4239554.1 hypothetical protein CNMCM6805_005765 [Aspergillus fumigatiaffinis]KAF4249242.1 hypothetical protein CNMCM8980_004198 [Aspergillus fumigatiaffinis]
MADGLNQARALRVAEIVNDYRTLLIHIPQQNVQAPPEDAHEEGYVVLRESIAAARTLISASYNARAVPTQASSEEMERAELQRVILDASARRFQAHKVYLRAAAARRWAIHRQNILRGQRAGPQHASQLKAVDDTFRQELQQITDSHVLADLRAADVRAGHWLEDDPSLSAILALIRSQS